MKARCFFRGFLITLLAFSAGPLGTAAEPSQHSPALIFDDWAPSEKVDGFAKDSLPWKSPSGKFSIIFQRQKVYEDDFTLVGKNMTTGATVVLVYGTRSADAKWFKTRMGEIALIDYAGDPDYNELFVVLPSSSKNEAPWTLLYRTPNMELGAGHFLEHAYWSLVRLDPDQGSMKLKALWSYSDVTNRQRKAMKTDGVYDVPLFYGYK